VGEGHFGLVEHVSAMIVLVHISTNSYRQIFGTLPKNMDEEDMLEPNVSTLDILMAQRARKAAAKRQAEEESETESESENEIRNPAHTSNAQPSGSGSTPTLTSTSPAGGLHQAPSSELESPQGRPSHAFQQARVRPSTPPLASSSAAGHLRQAPSP
jgi:hypothetical protein